MGLKQTQNNRAHPWPPATEGGTPAASATADGVGKPKGAAGHDSDACSAAVHDAAPHWPV